MTLSEMASYVTGKVGQVDAASVTMCKTFINRRYDMIWNAFAWTDAELIYPTTASGGGNGQFNLTGLNFDRIIGIRAAGNFLDPVSPSTLLQTDPTIFERAGPPTVYYEQYDATIPNRIVQLLPLPIVATEILIIGKRPFVALADSDSPVLRNIDNCLLAYAQADMLQKLRQYSKADKMVEEGGALLEAAKKIETEQANRPRRVKPLTVSGNSLEELSGAVAARTGEYSPESVPIIKELLRRNYQTVYDACNWSEATVMANVTTDGSEIVLPVYFDRIISLRADVNLGQLSVVEPSLYFGIAPGIFEQTGTPVAFSYLTPVAVAILPPTREKLAIKSSVSTDKSKVFVMGESAGGHLSETVVLNGTTEVNTVNDYDTPLTVSKGITAGDVRIRAQTSDIVLETILAAERERKHMRIWVQPTPSTSQTCLVLGKRTIKPLVQDEDTPLLRDIGNVLIAMTAADVFAKNGNDKASAEARTQAGAALKTLIDLETNQGAYSARVVPEVEYCYDMACGVDDWIVQKV